MDSQNPENPIPPSEPAAKPVASLRPEPKASQPFEAYSKFSSIEQAMQTYLVDNAPFQLPDDVKEFFVKVAPWGSIIALMISLPIVFAGLGCSMLMAGPLAALGGAHGAQVGIFGIFGSLIAAGMVFCYGMGISGLFKRSKSGWTWSFYALLLNIVSTVLSFWISGLLSTLICFYLLAQMKSKYVVEG